ncbi:MAG TPA: hypothetical protein VMT55_01715 [Candidatus Sulfotelmatobacter sp.]|nr:hypothetical protein [Candidatus Sulfotelmatobacter sp.]
MKKAENVLKDLREIHRTRVSRLEEHVGFGPEINCNRCHSWKAYDGWKVDYCPEAQRLADRIRAVETRARSIALAVLDNVAARG